MIFMHNFRNQPRIVVITKFRILTLKKSTFTRKNHSSLQVSKSLHLYSLHRHSQELVMGTTGIVVVVAVVVVVVAVIVVVVMAIPNITWKTDTENHERNICGVTVV